MFDSAFHQVMTAPRQFTDPRLPNGLRPFNVQALNGHIFVTYDSVNPATGFEGTGPHAGAVDEFSTHGHLISRIASGGKLNAPLGARDCTQRLGARGRLTPGWQLRRRPDQRHAKYRHHCSS